MVTPQASGVGRLHPVTNRRIIRVARKPLQVRPSDYRCGDHLPTDAPIDRRRDIPVPSEHRPIFQKILWFCWTICPSLHSKAFSKCCRLSRKRHSLSRRSTLRRACDRVFPILLGAILVSFALRGQVQEADGQLAEGEHLAWLRNWQAAEPYF